MKPGFIIIVIIGIIIVWAVLQSSLAGVAGIDRSERTSTSQNRNSQREILSEEDRYGKTISPFAGFFELKKGRATKDDPREEYVEVQADRKNNSAITVTGWRIQSLDKRGDITIGNVARIPRHPERSYETQTVDLEPGHSAYIITGRSPINTSFRTNICTGYFEETKDFSPRLSRQCPDVESEELERWGIDSTPRENSSDEECIKSLERIGRCENPGKPNENLNRDCREYINEIGYELCAEIHVGDSNFLGDEWYVYASSVFDDMWDDKGDTILLLDSAGRIVDSVSY